MPRTRHTIIPAVQMILRKGDQVLLARRFQTGYEDGKYGLPAGHVDGNESLARACVREAKEEVGVTVLVNDLKLFHIVSRLGDDGERVDFFFETTKWAGEPKIMEPHKCDEVSWSGCPARKCCRLCKSRF